MAATTIKAASVPSLRRLAGYYHVLKTLERELQFVSCTRIAAEMGSDPTQVRKDIEATGLVGKPKVGYALDGLLAAIETFLGWDSRSDAFLAGAGHMGCALLGYPRFSLYGVNIVTVFDVDPAKVGTVIHKRHVLPLEKLTPLAKRMHIPIGIIATPAESAQDIADRMVAGGIRAIWNFAPARLTLPESVIIENVSLASSLAVLTNRLTRLMATGTPTLSKGA